MRRGKTARLLYGATDLGAAHFSADMLWRTGFHVPDPLFLAEIAGEIFLFASPLEAGRARKEADVDHVVRTVGSGRAAVIDFLKARGIWCLEIPADFPYAMGTALGKEFSIAVASDPWYPGRAKKSRAEIHEIRLAQRATERAFAAVMDFLRGCRIRGSRVYHDRRPATSEMARHIIDDALWKQGYLATDTIVASGVQAADPHCIGRGALRARVPIVIDIFPVSRATHYYADMTRTVFKGEPSEEYAKMYETVLAAQEQAIASIRAGTDGKEIYDSVCRYFEEAGYPTRTDGKTSEGFIHGLGHGVGMEIHEHPNLGARNWKLEAGNVITVEPGLYYPFAPSPLKSRGWARSIIPAGGIRIEDMVLVTKTGYERLTKFPKDLTRMIIS